METARFSTCEEKPEHKPQDSILSVLPPKAGWFLAPIQVSNFQELQRRSMSQVVPAGKKNHAWGTRKISEGLEYEKRGSLKGGLDATLLYAKNAVRKIQEFLHGPFRSFLRC